MVCGAGRAFCSGYDLKDDAATPAPNAEALARAPGNAISTSSSGSGTCPKPTIAAVHGYCLAGGLELAMSCDITIAEEGCRFGEPELKFGSVIVNMMMPWLIGPKLTKELLLSGDDTLSAGRAERIGLVNRVVAKGTHVDEAVALAARIAALDADAVVRTKAAINRGFEIMGLHEALRAGLDAAVEIEAMETPSARGVQATGARAGPEGGACLARSALPRGRPMPNDTYTSGRTVSGFACRRDVAAPRDARRNRSDGE